MLNEDHHRYIRKLLMHKLNGNFAFYIDEGGNGLPTVYYAQDEGPWSCIVNLVQHMGNNPGAEMEGANIFIPPNTPYEGAAKGACLFFQIVVWRFSYDEGINNDMLGRVDALMSTLSFARFQRVNSSAILMRPQLDGFRPQNLGPAPMISLQGFTQTHLHRIYMALAFHRVRTKYERNEQGLAIGSVLADALSGQVYVIAHNTKNINLTYHNEVNAVQTLLRYHPHMRNAPLILYSTLEPCPMCAAMIAEMLPATTVFYGQTDPGKHMERMGPKPPFCFSMRNPLVLRGLNGETIVDLPVKPLYGYDYSLTEKSDNDIATFLNNRHQVLKGHGNHSLTRNLYDDQIKQGIGNASRTLDRKLKQYDPRYTGDERKLPLVPGDERRTRRRLAIQQLIRYLRPLFSPE